LNERARRSLRLELETSAGALEVQAELERVPGARSLRVESIAGGRVRAYVELADEDPRAFLAGVCASPSLPRVSAIEYGQLSLPELYRVLYGVEAC
jgi:hypothetical protein